MRDLHGGLFVLADEELGIVVAVVDEAVVQAAETSARVDRHVLEPVVLQQINDQIRLILFVPVGRFFLVHCCRPDDSSGPVRQCRWRLGDEEWVVAMAVEPVSPSNRLSNLHCTGRRHFKEA